MDSREYVYEVDPITLEDILRRSGIHNGSGVKVKLADPEKPGHYRLHVYLTAGQVAALMARELEKQFPKAKLVERQYAEVKMTPEQAKLVAEYAGK